MIAFAWLPEGVGDPIRYLVLAGLSVMLMGAAKSGFGGGIGLLSMPLMVSACAENGALALGVMLIILVACDYVSLPLWWGKWDWPNVKMLLPGMILGTVVGTGILWCFLHLGQPAGVVDQATLTKSMARPNAALSLFIGLVCCGFVALQVLRWIKGDLKPFRPTAMHGMIAGSSAGVISTLAHVAGPITNMYLLPQGMTKGRFVATTVLYYWIGNQIKLLPYFALGLLNVRTASASVALMPAVVVGALIGIFVHKRVNEKLFSRIVYVLLAVMGVHLVVTAGWKLATIQ